MNGSAHPVPNQEAVKLWNGYLSRNLTMRLLQSIPLARPTAFLAAALLYGCAPSRSEQNQQATPAENPLAGMIGRQLLVLPAQLLATAGPGGSWDVRPDAAPLLQLVDQEITETLRKRGIRGNWTFPQEIIGSARRNGGLAGNPLGLSVAGIRRVKAGDTPLPEPLASEIRTLVSLTSARYVIMPLETRVDVNGGQRKGSLRVLLIDARTARVLWAGDVEGQSSSDPEVVRDTMSPFGFRILARELAVLFANMVVPE